MKIPETLQNKKILIVDDVTSIRMLIRSILLDAGFKHVTEAKNGKEAINKLNHRHIDLIICDWNMPIMSGLELFREIHSKTEVEPAFIMLTSSSEAEKVNAAINSGVTNYLLKPFNAVTLIKHVLQALDD